MNTPNEEIIDLLTAYALGALEPEEHARMTALFDADPELRALAAELQQAASTLPYALPEAEPRPELRQQVLDAAVGRRAPAPAAAIPPPRRSGGLFRGWMMGLGGLAAAALIAATLGWARVGQLQTELAQARATQATAQAIRQQEISALAQPVAFQLTGQQGSASLYQSPNGTVMLAVHLPKLSEQQVYQLWTISGEDAPNGAGVFNVDENGYALIPLNGNPAFAQADILAITVEPGPNGSAAPTSNPLVAGKRSA